MKENLIKFYKLLFLRPSARKFNQFLLQCAVHGLGVLNYKNSKDSGELYVIKKL